MIEQAKNTNFQLRRSDSFNSNVDINKYNKSWAEVLSNMNRYKIIDIRDPVNYQMYRVKGSLNLRSLEEIKQKNINGPLIISCYKGRSSPSFALRLREEGYEAYSVKKGIEGFKEETNFKII
ncbi:GLPE [Hepatospora eriocheir]|uniref:GLPE n=1 Tax=Hepatospora eriocheir TaxID=1081669 RepID=A0A1X0QC92_9MICR|nr:GLPE [Hepatospora eriocheir]